MKIDSLKNKLIIFTGALAGLFVLGLVLFSPSQNASAISVSDEIDRRMTAMAAQESNQYAVGEMLAAAELDTQDNSVDNGYELSQKEKAQFFGEVHQQELPIEEKSAPSVDVTETDGEETVSTQEEAEDTGAPVLLEADAAPELLDEPPISEEVPFELSITKTVVQTGVPTVVPTRNPTRVIIYFPTREPTEEPTQVPTEAPILVPTEEPTAEPTEVPTEEPTSEPTEVPTAEPTMEPTQVPTQEPTAAPDIFWSAGFETGDISEWTDHGDWLRQGTTATYQVQEQTAHSGDYAVKFSIDTSSNTSQAAYLFYWDVLPNTAYYSAWYYIPSNIQTEVWWNIMQWKSTYNGDSDYSRPVFVLDGAIFGQTAISLCHLPDKNVDKVCWKQTQVMLPRDQWFQIEVYYERSKTNGHVIVWQDGVKLFDITGYPTVLSDGTLYYSVNHYTDGMSPDISSIFIDDVVISYDRLSHDPAE